MNDVPTIDNHYLLEKFAGKGGWTFAVIPEIPPDKKAPFGWVKVKGTIDGFEISKYHLMPMGNGKLFLPVKAAIRKIIKKSAGDMVHVILCHDNEPTETPSEFIECLKEEPKALHFFNTLNDADQKKYTDWIYSAKSEEVKVSRIAESMDTLMRQKRWNE